MTIETPPHLERCEFVYLRHSIDLAVTVFAHDLELLLRIHVHLMGEVNELGEGVNLNPLDRAAISLVSTYRVDLGYAGTDDEMTVHA